MKQRVFFKTMSFHSLFIKKKKDAPNGVVLNGTMHILLPLDAHRQGKNKIVPLHRLSPSLSQKPKKTRHNPLTIY
jgi:hypothetical protein